MSISVEKLHHQIRLRILSCGRMSENHRGPEVIEVKDSVVECLNSPAKIASKELAPTHFVKSGTRQNACSTRPRVDADLGKRAHIVKLMNNPKKIDDNSAVGKMGMNEDPLPTKATIDQGNLAREVITNWDEDLLNVDQETHNNWVAYFGTWKPPKSLLRKGTNM